MTEETKIKCSECRGNKLIMGAGYIEHKCPKCSGNGWIMDNLPHMHLPEENANGVKIEVLEPIAKVELVKPALDLNLYYPCGQKRPKPKVKK